MAEARLEDPPLLRGRARFVDDIHIPGLLHAAFVRSPHAHAAIEAIDRDMAQARPGVSAVLTMDDFRPRLAAERLAVGLPSAAYRQIRDRPVLACAEVVHVGEAVAVVIADDRYRAEDAAAAVDVRYRPLPAVVDCRDAEAAGAPPVHLGAPHNLLAEIDMAFGDVDTAFRGAAHIVAESYSIHRGCGHPLECRGAVALPDPLERRLTLWSSTQTPHAGRRVLARMLGWPESAVRVAAPAVGGGFGPKLVTYPEEIAAALAALILEAPVKWIEDRREHFVATTQERDQHWQMEAAFDRDGALRGLRGSMLHDHGAYTARGANLPYESALTVTLPYDVPAYALTARAVLTNKVPVTPVRGAGHPQAVFVMERLLDRGAAVLGLGRDEIRRRNLIAADRMPCARPLKTRGGAPVVLDSGDYLACQEAALAAADWAGFPDRRRRAGGLRGIGLANFVKGTGRGPFESARIGIDVSGRIELATGAAEMGQGIETTLAGLVAAALGTRAEGIAVTSGDTGAVGLGIGGFNSRQAVTAGSSAWKAAETVRAKAIAIAAEILETAAEDLEAADGGVRVRGAPEISVGFGRLAEAVSGTPGAALPAGVAPGLAATETTVLDAMPFANGSAVAEVEIDPETGGVTVVSLVLAHDCGRILHRRIVEGQIVGGVAHALGNALFERMAFDEEGQPLTASFADYLMVGAADVPRIAALHRESPSPLNPIGVKGAGECGVVPSSAAVISAIEDALAGVGAPLCEMPVAPASIAAMLRP